MSPAEGNKAAADATAAWTSATVDGNSCLWQQFDGNSLI
jgi:hypothetical protein